MSFCVIVWELVILKKVAIHSLTLIDIGEDLLTRTLIEQALRPTINGTFIELKSFSLTKDTVMSAKQQATEWEKIFNSYISNRS